MEIGLLNTVVGLQSVQERLSSTVVSQNIQAQELAEEVNSSQQPQNITREGLQNVMTLDAIRPIVPSTFTAIDNDIRVLAAESKEASVDIERGSLEQILEQASGNAAVVEEAVVKEEGKVSESNEEAETRILAIDAFEAAFKLIPDSAENENAGADVIEAALEVFEGIDIAA